MNSISPPACLHSASALGQVEEIDPAALKSESSCSLSDVLMLVFAAIAAIVIQAAAFSFS